MKDKNNLIKESVIYKGKEYLVTNPGELMFSTTKYTNSKKSMFEIVDQLDDCKEITRGRQKYLTDKYGISELEYYIIVVLRGREDMLPKCTYINPYTGESCNNYKKFRTLVPGTFQRTKNRKGIFFCGCEEHTLNAATQLSQKENYLRGVTGIQKADRRSKIWRKKLSDHAKRQMSEGRSIFSPDEIRDNMIPSVNTYRIDNSTGIGMYESIAERLGISILDFENPIDFWILLDKEYYIERGEASDICYYYFTLLVENRSLFKLGVTNNLETRSSGYGYHNMTYFNPEILFTSDRVTIANLEYDVKMAFKDKIKLGHETFSIEDKDIILEFIKERISYYESKTGCS